MSARDTYGRRGKARRRPFAGGRISPRNVARGVIVCGCGYTGEPLEVKRWAEFGIWMGLCPACQSSRAVQPRKRRAER